MPKKVKTKKQKMLADLRRKNPTHIDEMAESAVYSLPNLHKPEKMPDLKIDKPRVSDRAVSTIGYSYLIKDLKKTILLTISIVIAELLIRYYFKI